MPQFQHFETYNDIEALSNHAEKFDNELWWYGCISPKYPWPTYHMDDYLQGARAVGWMQKYNKITGNLFWGVNTLFQWNNNLSNNMVMVDPYKNPIRFISAAGGATGVSGDGYLLYPSTKYQTDMPFSSLRLSAIRAGNDDYDLICTLEDIYTQIALENGITQIDINKTLETVFKQLFTQSKYHHDGSLIYQAREVLFELIAAAKSEAKIIYAGSIGLGDNKQVVFYSSAPTAVINGESINGQVAGSVYKYVVKPSFKLTKNYADAKFVLNNESYNLKVFLDYYITKATNFANSIKDGIELSTASNMKVTPSNESAEIVIKSHGNTNIEKRLFKPGFSILNSALGSNVNKLKDVNFEIENISEQSITFAVHLVAGSFSREVNLFTLNAGQTRKIEINNLYLTDWSNIAAFTKIQVYCDNIDNNGNLLPDRAVRISEVYYSMVGE